MEILFTCFLPLLLQTLAVLKCVNDPKKVKLLFTLNDLAERVCVTQFKDALVISQSPSECDRKKKKSLEKKSLSCVSKKTIA